MKKSSFLISSLLILSLFGCTSTPPADSSLNVSDNPSEEQTVAPTFNPTPSDGTEISDISALVPTTPTEGYSVFIPASEDESIAVTMELSNITSAGLTVTLRQYENRDDCDLMYGEAYSLERFTGSNWEKVSPIIDNGAFTDIGYTIPNGGEAVTGVHWDWLYGTLTPGTYRISKIITDNNNRTTPNGAAAAYTLTAQFILPGEQTNHEMIPFDTENTGVYGGYFFIPINGKIYRYYSAPETEHYVTVSDLVFECTEDCITEKYEHYIYELLEYPDLSVLFDVCKDEDGNTLSETFIACKPAEAASQEEIDRVMNSGYVIMENGSVIGGKDVWLDFCEKTTAGESASVRLAYIYTLDKENCSYELFEAIEDDYPELFLKELTFNGDTYTIGPLHYDGEDYSPICVPGYDSPQASWKYLVHFTGEPSVPGALYTEYDRYVLVNDESVEWRDLEWGTFSSQMDDFIPFDEVFCEYAWNE